MEICSHVAIIEEEKTYEQKTRLSFVLTNRNAYTW